MRSIGFVFFTLMVTTHLSAQNVNTPNPGPLESALPNLVQSLQQSATGRTI